MTDPLDIAGLGSAGEPLMVLLDAAQEGGVDGETALALVKRVADTIRGLAAHTGTVTAAEELEMLRNSRIWHPDDDGRHRCIHCEQRFTQGHARSCPHQRRVEHLQRLVEQEPPDADLAIALARGEVLIEVLKAGATVLHVYNEVNSRWDELVASGEWDENCLIAKVALWPDLTEEQRALALSQWRDPSRPRVSSEVRRGHTTNNQQPTTNDGVTT